MLTDAIRIRLEELNRQPLAQLRLQQRAVQAIEQVSFAAPGSEHENSSGKHWRLQQPLARFWPDADRHVAALRPPATEWSLRAEAGSHPELTAFAESFPHGSLFLDLETCGFAGSMVFLIGLVRSSDQGLVLDQLFARNYAEERAILETLWQYAAQSTVLVTFNGKSFDWPMVQDRSVLHRLDRAGIMPAGPHRSPADRAPALVHCDLLHHARRKWKGLLPDCKLQTLERYVCRRRRGPDIGGAHIPLAYHEFVRGGKWEPLQSMLHHNALDLVTLVEVVLSLACGRKDEKRSRTAREADGRNKKAADLPEGRSRPE